MARPASITGTIEPRLSSVQPLVVTSAPEALYVIYPKTDSWGVQTVPRQLGTFANRQDLPAGWAGLQAEELSALTGVPDALFCHSARFLAVARSFEGALTLARQALDGSEPV